MAKINPVPITPDNGVAETARSVNRRIGAILVESGQLTIDKTENIYRFQREEGVLFGEAAIRMGLLSQHDIDLALARQFDFAPLVPGKSDVSHEVFAAYRPSAPEVEPLRHLRTALMLRHFDNAATPRSLTLISAERDEGRSVLAANLAVMFAQLGKRTLLIDADLRNPRQHRLFGLTNRSGLSTILAGRNSTDVIQPVAGLGDLYLLPAGLTPPNPHELLGRALLPLLLKDLGRSFDVILIDTSPLGEYGDAQTVAACAGSALVVARDNFSHVPAMQKMVHMLAQARVAVVGSVLNKF